MKRYFSHYSFIYPDIYLKNHIIEMDEKGIITRQFPFERELEKTEFYAGLLIFIPDHILLTTQAISDIKGSCFANQDLSVMPEVNIIRYKTE